MPLLSPPLLPFPRSCLHTTHALATLDDLGPPPPLLPLHPAPLRPAPCALQYTSRAAQLYRAMLDKEASKLVAGQGLYGQASGDFKHELADFKHFDPHAGEPLSPKASAGGDAGATNGEHASPSSPMHADAVKVPKAVSSLSSKREAGAGKGASRGRHAGAGAAPVGDCWVVVEGWSPRGLCMFLRQQCGCHGCGPASEKRSGSGWVAKTK